MSNQIPDFPAFDMLVGQMEPPYRGFGEIATHSHELERQLHLEAAQMLGKIRDSFGVKLTNSSMIPKELDDIIENMWGTGWDPRVGNLNLFTRSFGLLLIEAMLDLLGGRLIFRIPGPQNVYVHNSLLWPGVEVFPFHKAFKCLTESHGENMAYFVYGVGQELESKGLLPAGAEERLPRARYSRNGA